MPYPRLQQSSQYSPAPKKMRTAIKKKFKSARKYSQPVKVSFRKQPFSKQLYNTLKYAQVISFTFTLGSTGGAKQFVTNGMFDPYVPSGGHQPLYYDQLMAIYDHYTVLKSRCRVKFIDGADYPMTYSMYIDDDTSVDANVIGTVERPYSSWDAVNPVSRPPNDLFLSWDAKETFGGDPQSDPTLQGSTGQDPTESSYFTINCLDNSSARTGTIYALVFIEYDVVYDELKTIAQS